MAGQALLSIGGGSSPPGSPHSPTGEAARASVLASLMNQVAELSQKVSSVPLDVRELVSAELEQCRETIAHESVSSIVAKLQASNAENEEMEKLGRDLSPRSRRCWVGIVSNAENEEMEKLGRECQQQFEEMEKLVGCRSWMGVLWGLQMLTNP